MFHIPYYKVKASYNSIRDFDLIFHFFDRLFIYLVHVASNLFNSSICFIISLSTINLRLVAFFFPSICTDFHCCHFLLGHRTLHLLMDKTHFGTWTDTAFGILFFLFFCQCHPYSINVKSLHLCALFHSPEKLHSCRLNWDWGGGLKNR